MSLCQKQKGVYVCVNESEFDLSGPIKNGFIYKVTMFQSLAFSGNPQLNSAAHLLFT